MVAGSGDGKRGGALRQKREDGERPSGMWRLRVSTPDSLVIPVGGDGNGGVTRYLLV